MMKANQTLMAQILTTPWWVQLLRGVLALSFGFYTINQPALTLMLMVQFLGAFVFIEGLVLVYMAIANKTGETKRAFVALRGVLYVLAGLGVLFSPILSTLITTVVLGTFVGLITIFGGMMEIVAGMRTEKSQKSEWSLILLGVLTVVFGVMIVSAPVASGVALSLFFGVWSLVSGCFLVVNSFRIRSGKKHLDHFVAA